MSKKALAEAKNREGVVQCKRTGLAKVENLSGEYIREVTVCLQKSWMAYYIKQTKRLVISGKTGRGLFLYLKILERGNSSSSSGFCRLSVLMTGKRRITRAYK